MEQKHLFFSIIIPAHNEEKYIANTLKNISNLDYPFERFEVFIIENGSNDKTYEIAKSFDAINIKTLKSEFKGVSRAKNFGIKQVENTSDWIIFLDADTIIEPSFLSDLNAYLNKNKDKNFTIGTTSIKPLENKGWYAMAWMKFYDVGHKLTKTSFAIQIMKASLKDRVKFNEELHLAEDLQLIKDCLKYGKFFYLDTDTVFTSVRRFENYGWFGLFLKWNIDALLWRFRNSKHDYPVIR